MDPTSTITARQRIVVMAVAALVLGLVLLRPTPEIRPSIRGGEQGPVVAEEPSLTETAKVTSR